MNNVYDRIRRLVEWAAPPGTPVLTLYLDISPGGASDALEFVESRAHELRTHPFARGNRPFEELLRTTIRKLPAAVDRSRRDDYDGLAVFASTDPPLDETIPLRFALENQAMVGRDPFLRHLLHYAEEYEPCVAVAVEGDRARVSEIHVGDLVQTRVVKASHRRDLAGELNVALARLSREQPRLHVFLLGSRERVEPIVSQLGSEIVARIIGRVDTALDPGSSEFFRVVHRALLDQEQRAEARGIERLLAGRHDPEVAVVGVEDTLAVINRGRIGVLYVLWSFRGAGWLCDACDWLGAAPVPPACLACGATVAAVPLEEHVLDQAAACGAEIDTVHESRALEEVGGIGALVGVTMP